MVFMRRDNRGQCVLSFLFIKYCETISNSRRKTVTEFIVFRIFVLQFNWLFRRGIEDDSMSHAEDTIHDLVRLSVV